MGFVYLVLLMSYLHFFLPFKCGKWDNFVFISKLWLARKGPSFHPIFSIYGCILKSIWKGNALSVRGRVKLENCLMEKYLTKSIYLMIFHLRHILQYIDDSEIYRLAKSQSIIFENQSDKRNPSQRRESCYICGKTNAFVIRRYYTTCCVVLRVGLILINKS
jgi:hypothetical protein